jgi:2-succinyl-6-hydroxy-2,4-cyclohexadiene-1-carboxylate synthase
MLKLCFLHGFLGTQEDWKAVIGWLPGIACTALDYPFAIPKDAILVGYSMGGRIALRYPNPKIVISSHPGLQTSQEREQRGQQDQQWIEMIQTVPFATFLENWHAQPLFESLREHPNFPQILARRLKYDPAKAIQQLQNESLSLQQQLYSDAVFVYGEKDLKYGALYTKLGINALKIKGGGHAIHLENPRGCAEAIVEGIRQLHRH